MSQQTAWTVTPLHVGVCRISTQHVYGKSTPESRLPFTLYVYLAECQDHRVLVDLGPKTLPYLNEMFVHYGFFRPGVDGQAGPDDIAQPHGGVFDHLARRGLCPEDIDHVIFTHLHCDHHGMDRPENAGALEDFPNAVFHLSRTGWRQNLDKRTNGSWNSYVDYRFSDYILELDQAGRAAFDEDGEILPGLRSLHLGGHAACSRALIFDTADGTLVISSDEIYHYEYLAQGILGCLHTTPQAMLDANEKLVALVEEQDAILLPAHDATVWELTQAHQAAWPQAAREQTRQAVKGYRQATPTLDGRALRG